MEAVWQSFRAPEKFLSGSLVESSANIRPQGEVSDVVVGVAGHADPVLELVALNIVNRPEPTLLSFDHVELAFEPKRHGAMTDM